jgi:hypothetical protein
MPKQVLELLKRIRQSVTMRALGGLALLAVTFAYAKKETKERRKQK